MAKIEKHVHKLKRHSFKSGNQIYFCALPDCHYKTAPALALGKRTICWRCGNDFIMNEYSLRLAKPHCENCHQPKVVKDDTGREAEPISDRPMRIPIFPENRELRQGEISTGENLGMSLADRFTKLIKSKAVEEDEL